MATYLDGNVRRATPNTVTAMKRNAAAATCPKCHRKSALKTITDDWGDRLVRITYCRWKTVQRKDWPNVTPRWYCDYEDIKTIFEYEDDQSSSFTDELGKTL